MHVDRCIRSCKVLQDGEQEQARSSVDGEVFPAFSLASFINSRLVVCSKDVFG